jgi:hypothetical protein
MHAPTDENIREVAAMRARGRDVNLDALIARATHYATRPVHPATTAPQAVAWALLDLVPHGAA